MKKYDLTVIGAGSGGLVAAATASGMGAKVLLIENRKMGGDCLNYGCVPSKTFLKSCHLMKQIKRAKKYGVSVNGTEVSLKDIMKRVSSVIKEIEPHDSKERFESLGVDVVFGNAKIETKNTILLNDKIYTTKKIIIATGSTAVVPPIKGIEKIEYYTNESIFEMEQLPKKLIVLGAGPIGLELGQGFANLGSEVFIIDKNESIFSKDEPIVSDIMLKELKEDGVQFFLGYNIIGFDKTSKGKSVKLEKNGKEIDLTADAILFALGRKPNTKNLGLENVGVDTNSRGYIKVNDKLQTTVPGIYAIGDVRGKYLFTHMASYEAGVAVKNALILPMFKTNYYNVAWTTYTSPEVAHVGYLKSEAEQLGKYYSEQVINIKENDRSKADDDTVGFIKVILDKKSRVIGATIVSEKAADLITQLSLMVTHKMKISSVMSVIYQYPIEGEIVKSVALKHFKQNVKPWQLALVKKIATK